MANTDSRKQKNLLRQAAKLTRRQAFIKHPTSAQSLVGAAGECASFKEPQIIAGYWPIADEIDPRPLLRWLKAQGHFLCLPDFHADHTNKSLLFRPFRFEDALVQSRHGLLVPMADQPACIPGVLLVPLLAFDRKGNRLGYGGGYFDRALEELRAKGTCIAIGLAFAEQEVASLPKEPWDHKLDAILTPQELIRVDL